MTIVTRIISTSLALSKEINCFAQNLIQLFLYIFAKVNNILHAKRAAKDLHSLQQTINMLYYYKTATCLYYN